MRQEPKAFVPASRLAVECGLIASESELGDGTRDRVVEAAVQRPEVVRADGSVQLHRQAGYCLTDIAIILDHL